MAAELSLLFKLKAQNEAGATLKNLEASIASLKARIKEVRTESDIGFRTERIAAHQERLRLLTAQHKELKDSIKASATAHEDLTSALSAVSPRIGGLVSSLSSAVGPLAAVAVGLAAIGGGVVALFELTKGAAEFQGKMFDLSQQTGVNVETLSALEIVAKTSGGNIDAIAQSVFIFQQKLEDAQDPTSKEAALLKTLGIETRNTEEAFRQTLSVLARMPAGFQQSDTAAQLFGSRGGKQVLGVLKEMNGDLDGAIERFRKMGILITTDAAIAADKFNDQLAEVGFQLRAVTAIIGNEAMPVILDALKRVSQALVDNQGNISLWTSELFDAAKGAIFLAERISGLIPLLQDLAAITPGKGTVLDLLFRATPVGGAIGALADLERLRAGPFAGVTGGAEGVGPTGGIRRTGGGGRGGGGRRAPRDTELQDATRDARLTEREELQLIERNVIENRRALDEQVRDIEEFTRRAIELDNQILAAKINRISAESNALEAALAKRLIKQDDYEAKQRELDSQAFELNHKQKDDQFKLEQQRDREISAAQIAAKRRELQIAEDADERAIARIRDRVKRTQLVIQDAIREEMATLTRELNQGVEGLKEAGNIDLINRPQVKNLDGTISTVRSMSVEVENLGEVLIPTVSELGKLLSDFEAFAEFQRTGKHLGIFEDSASATAFAERLHIQQARIVELKNQLFSEADAERQIASIIDEGFKRRREALEKEQTAYSTTLERRIAITDELIRLDGERAGAAEDASRRIIEALERERKAEFDRQNEAAQGATRPRKVFEEPESPFDIDLEGLAKSIEETIVPLNEILANSFFQVADAIGSTVAQWVLLGETGPAVMRKILAQALATIAAEAAVNAIKELALGFAMLFLNPADSAAHFTSAALWGSIAGVAAIAGRGVAGDLFKPQSHGRESSSGSTSPQELNPLTLGRNPRSNDQPLVVHVDVRQDRHSIVDVWMDDFTTGGRTREATNNDGGVIP